MGSQQQFCLKWNNHQSNMLVVFDQLLQNEAFVDVTLACEGISLKAHKMVLSACSPYFQNLFLENPCKHPIVILNSIRYCDLKAIVDFMYKGEVNVSQEQLSALLKTADALKVKGLAEVTNQTTKCLAEAQQQQPQPPSTPPVTANVTTTSQSSSPPPKRKKIRNGNAPSPPPVHQHAKVAPPPDTSEHDSRMMLSMNELTSDKTNSAETVNEDEMSSHAHTAEDPPIPPELTVASSPEPDDKSFLKTLQSQIVYDPTESPAKDYPQIPTTLSTLLTTELNHPQHSISFAPSTSGIQNPTPDSCAVTVKQEPDIGQTGDYDTDNLLPPTVIWQARLNCENNIRKLATSLARYLFSVDERLASNACPTHGSRSRPGHPGLDKARLNYLRRVVFREFNVPPESEHEAWHKCVAAINAHFDWSASSWLKQEVLATAFAPAIHSAHLSLKDVSFASLKPGKLVHGKLMGFSHLPNKLPLKRGPKTLLTEEEENAVVDYIHSFTGRGTRPRRDEIIRFASSILRQKSGVKEEDQSDMGKTKVGIKWWKKFRARHPELRDMRGNIPKERSQFTMDMKEQGGFLVVELDYLLRNRPHSCRKQRYKCWTQDTMDEAIAQVLQHGKSIASCSAYYKIPFETLRQRIVRARKQSNNPQTIRIDTFINDAIYHPTSNDDGLDGQHQLARVHVQRRCRVCYHIRGERHESIYMCVTCKVHVCNPTRRNCYDIHHSLLGRRINKLSGGLKKHLKDNV
uniref:BTB domain-containing protein n=1 Tax=Strigamia maritima TaxID=126957 RepID=T1INN3_STRMM